MEVCTTLGMLTPEQAQELRMAGLTAYNHNLDTSPEFYPKVTTSRKYKVRQHPLIGYSIILFEEEQVRSLRAQQATWTSDLHEQCLPVQKRLWKFNKF